MVQLEIRIHYYHYYCDCCLALFILAEQKEEAELVEFELKFSPRRFATLSASTSPQAHQTHQLFRLQLNAAMMSSDAADKT